MSCDDRICNPNCSKEHEFNIRTREILAGLRCDYPGLFIYVDFWRLDVVNKPMFSDDGIEVQVRLEENVLAFFDQTLDRWYQKEEGIITQSQSWLLIPEELEVTADDIAVINGVPYLIIEIVKKDGIAKLKIDEQKARWNKPIRFAPTYRQIGVKATFL